MLGKVGRIVNGRSVALVGNAKSLMSEQKADEIDAHDVVIRINMGIPKVVGDFAGKRTDIWVTARQWSGCANQECDLMVFMKLTPIGGRDWDAFCRDKSYKTPKVRWPQSLADECVDFCQCDPGCGLRWLWLLKKKLTPKSVSVYGMDCWQTPSTWNGRMNTPNHNPAREAEVIKQLCQ
tara:strand:- start:1218 stop:1754 length:537 start_codon:yes stop_codon:yes gene_type:complete